MVSDGDGQYAGPNFSSAKRVSISFDVVTARRRSGFWRSRLALALVALAAIISCRSILPTQYEYDEEINLSLDGSATMFVNGSVPALVALRGVPLDPSPAAPLDREAVSRFFTSNGVHVARIGTSRRNGRHFVHLRLVVSDVRRLHETSAFSWERIALTRAGDQYVYTETVGAPAGTVPAMAGWRGNELVAFRLHLPARIRYHNAPTRRVERGNILEWEQSLADRLKGEPVHIEARMDQESILYSTLTLFGLMALLVAVTFVVIIWWVVRKGRREAGVKPSSRA
jgi:hypothetical protein